MSEVPGRLDYWQPEEHLYSSLLTTETTVSDWQSGTASGATSGGSFRIASTSRRSVNFTVLQRGSRHLSTTLTDQELLDDSHPFWWVMGTATDHMGVIVSWLGPSLHVDVNTLLGNALVPHRRKFKCNCYLRVTPVTLCCFVEIK